MSSSFREVPVLSSHALARCHRTIAGQSRSFALASRLLPAQARDEAVVVYTWCRRADDAVDGAGRAGGAEALERLRGELEAVGSEARVDEPVLDAFAEVVRTRRIPLSYPQGLIDGMAMDVQGTSYPEIEDLLRYCFHVAGTVGLMMCHVMGVRDDAALVRAAHLGMAMQLTNVCRDVREDWEMGRLYLPDRWLAEEGAPGLREALGGPFPAEAAAPVARVTRRLLELAERYYRSGEAGLPALSPRSALAVRTASRVYSAIGDRIADRGHDPLGGRAVVPTHDKVRLAARAAHEQLRSGWPLPARATPRPPAREVRREEVLAVSP